MMSAVRNEAIPAANQSHGAFGSGLLILTPSRIVMTDNRPVPLYNNSFDSDECGATK